MNKEFTGKIFRLRDDIDTDIIIPTQYLSYETIDEMKKYAFEPYRPELAAAIREGDIIVAGKNFGCGSSREQAPAVLAALTIRCVIANPMPGFFTGMQSITGFCCWRAICTTNAGKETRCPSVWEKKSDTTEKHILLTAYRTI